MLRQCLPCCKMEHEPGGYGRSCSSEPFDEDMEDQIMKTSTLLASKAIAVGLLMAVALIVSIAIPENASALVPVDQKENEDPGYQGEREVREAGLFTTRSSELTILLSRRGGRGHSGSSGHNSSGSSHGRSRSGDDAGFDDHGLDNHGFIGHGFDDDLEEDLFDDNGFHHHRRGRF